MMHDDQEMRRAQYARIVVALRDGESSSGSGVEGLFDQALTNGLAAIVHAEWPDELMNSRGHVRSARDLISVVEENAPALPPGRHVLEQLPALQGEEARQIVIWTGRLRTAIEQMAPVRHARPGATPRAIPEEALAALEALDDHPALGTLSDEATESMWSAAHESDQNERNRAAAYWTALPAEEQSRRSNPHFPDLLKPSTKDDLDDWPPQHCPVCGMHSLKVDGIDPFGFGYGFGVCLACGYRRSEDMAYDEAIDHAIGMHQDE